MIRRATPTDLPLLPAIEDAAGTRFAGTSAAMDADLPAVPMAAFAAAQAADCLWVAVAGDDVPVGFLLAERRAQFLHVRELDVHPDHGGRGLGRALIAAAVAAAPALGCTALSLTTFRDIPWNAPWYGRQGFVEVAAPDRPAFLSALLAEEAALGLDPANRCAMVRPL